MSAEKRRRMISEKIAEEQAIHSKQLRRIMAIVDMRIYVYIGEKLYTIYEVQPDWTVNDI